MIEAATELARAFTAEMRSIWMRLDPDDQYVTTSETPTVEHSFMTGEPRPVTFARKNPNKRCTDCERCRFDPGRYCGVADHPRCSVCRHCQYRHAEQQSHPERFGGSMA